MVTCRACKPKLQVRFLVLHPIIVLFLIVGVFAVDISDVDDSQYYDYSVDTVDIEPRSPIYSIPRSFSGVFGGTSLYSFWQSGGNNTKGSVKIGDYSFDENSTSILQALRAAMLMTVNVVDYVDSQDSTMLSSLDSLTSRLSTLENEVVRQSDFQWVGWSGDPNYTLMKRLDLFEAHWKTQLQDNISLQSYLTSIRDSIGLSATSSSGTVLAYLRSISNGVSSTIFAIDTFSNAVQASFSDVTTRQDAAQEWSKAFFGTGPLSFYRPRYSGASVLTGTFSDFITRFSLDFLNSHYSFDQYALGPDGKVIYLGDYPSLIQVVQAGMLGLSTNIAGSDKTASMTVWQGPDKTQTLSATNLLDMLGLLGTQLQSPLAKLAYVWADDDDIRIADKNQPVKDQIEEDFVGGGQGAVSASQIGGLADASSDFTSSFSGGGSITDVFKVINDSGNYGFFSQAVADEIEPPLPATLSDEDLQEQVDAWEELSEDDEFLSRFKMSDSGYLVPDLGIFDLSGYLEGIQ